MGGASKINEPFRAQYFAVAGDADAMFDSLDACYQRRDLLWVTWPVFDPYRSHPRFQALLAKMNLA